MCNHWIPAHVKRANTGSSVEHVESSFACQAYADYAAPLYGVLLLVVQCDDCADHALAHTFLAVRSEDGAKPSLAALLRFAFAYVCGGEQEDARPALQARITAWYAGALRKVDDAPSDQEYSDVGQREANG